MLLQSNKIDRSQLAEFYLQCLRFGDDTMQPSHGAQHPTLEMPSHPLPAAVFAGLPLAPLRPGSRLHCYTIGEMIGQGGMAQVFQATDEYGNLVAIKTPRVSSPWSNDQLGREFRIMQSASKSASNESIAEAMSLHQHSSFHYLVLEHIAGIDLKRWVRRQTPVGQLPDLDRVYHAMTRLSDVLATLHQQGIAHRDLKPENVIVDANGRVVLIDFGIATHIGTVGHWTDPNIYSATIHFLAPEIVLEHCYTCASDLYSLGRLLFVLLTGRLPNLDFDALAHWTTERFAYHLGAQLPLGTPSDLLNMCIGLHCFDATQRPSAERIHAMLNPSSRWCQANLASDADRNNDAERNTDAERNNDADEAYNERNTSAADIQYDDNDSHAQRLKECVTKKIGNLSNRGGLVALLTDQASGDLMLQVADAMASNVGGLVLRGQTNPNERIAYNALNPIISELARWLQKLPSPIQQSLEIPEDSALLQQWPILNIVRSGQSSSISHTDVVRTEVAQACSLHGAREYGLASLGRYLRRLTQERSVVLCVEALHFADTMSWKAIEMLHHMADDCPLIILATIDTKHRIATKRIRNLIASERVIDLSLAPSHHAV